jgi:hypothetical protein
VGALDQGKGALPQRLAEEVRDAVLRDDVLDVRLVTTPEPSASTSTMREIRPSLAVEGSAMMGLPPRERRAPRMKSTWPPNPE